VLAAAKAMIDSPGDAVRRYGEVFGSTVGR
jgi:hypothetical protein